MTDMLADMAQQAPTAEDERRGFWLRMARERANLSQPGAARMLGLSDKSASTLSMWEAGTREPSPSKLRAMADLYDVPIRLFYDPPPSAIETIDALRADQRIGDALSDDAEMVAEMRRRVGELRPSQQPRDEARRPANRHPRDT